MRWGWAFGSVLPGTANPVLADAIARTLGTEPVPCELERFPDGELRPVVGHLRGDDVYVILCRSNTRLSG